LTWSVLDELNIILPNIARISVNADVVDDKLIRLSDSSTSLTCWVVVEVIATANVVQIDCPKLDIRNCHKASAKKLLGINEVVESELHLDPFNPDISL
jgi:hypothetical protein